MNTASCGLREGRSHPSPRALILPLLVFGENYRETPGRAGSQGNIGTYLPAGSVRLPKVRHRRKSHATQKEQGRLTYQKHTRPLGVLLSNPLLPVNFILLFGCQSRCNVATFPC